MAIASELTAHLCRKWDDFLQFCVARIKVARSVAELQQRFERRDFDGATPTWIALWIMDR